MTYTVRKTDKKFEVIEKDTELTVFNSRQEKIARSLCRSLNLGSGFAGFTPSFFCFKYKKGD